MESCLVEVVLGALTRVLLGIFSNMVKSHHQALRLLCLSLLLTWRTCLHCSCVPFEDCEVASFHGAVGTTHGDIAGTGPAPGTLLHAKAVFSLSRFGLNSIVLLLISPHFWLLLSSM